MDSFHFDGHPDLGHSRGYLANKGVCVKRLKAHYPVNSMRSLTSEISNAGRRSTVPQAVDVHVGRQIRSRRKLLRLSQSELGAKVGVTFQQMQKYEKGANRVGASRLAAIAKALNCPTGDFFPDSDNVVSTPTDLAARLADLETRLDAVLRELRRLRQSV